MITKHKLLKGSPISGGIVLGHTRVVVPGAPEVPETVVSKAGVRAEFDALDRAVEKTVEQLREWRESAGKKMGSAVAKIFDAQLMIATDYEFLKQVKAEIVSQRRNAAYIYHNLVQNTTVPLNNSSDIYMRQMATDIEAVSRRVLSNLSGRDKCDLKFAPNTILVGKFFTPGEILSYRQSKAVGFLVSEGGYDSHMALIARALMLPIVMVDSAWVNIAGNSRIILDGGAGEAIINPSDEEWSEYQKRKKRHGPALIKKIKTLSPIPPVTRDGRTVTIAANLTLPGPADDILAERGIPVGLYRTEFFYISNGGFPDEESQFEYYSQITRKFSPADVVIRTFDLGYDKLSDGTIWPVEDNPALGWRGIRPMLEMNHIFKTQIRAILRASAFGKVKIMLPMISGIPEFERARKLISQCRLALRREGKQFDENVDVGIMVEVPSAALAAESLARRADFLSIGTNDLTQYTLAADRMNSKVAHLYNQLNPSVLHLIKIIIEAGRKHNKPVSICGEVAGSLLALPLFIGMGVGILSISPNRIVDLCRAVKKIDYTLVKHMASSVLASETTSGVIEKLRRYKEASAIRKTSTIGIH